MKTLSKQSKSTEIQSISSKDSVFTMPNLPGELITEILLRLPVKSLLQFRSVSKYWLSLIFSPDFVKTHLLLSASNKEYTHHGVVFEDSNAKHDVKGCSLSALLYDSVPEAFDLDYPDYLFLWNPSIRKFKKLPSYRHNLNHHYDDGLAHFHFGFGYDEFQDDYKVVGIFPIYRIARSCGVEVQIYSLKSDSWKRIDEFKGRELLDDPAKFVNGKLHWLDNQWNIISIDLGDEKWVEVEQPCCFKGSGFLMLGVFESDLFLFCNYSWTHVDVWVMKEYGVKESWTKMFTIKSPEDSRGQIFYPTILMSNEGEILLQFGSRFMKYNPKDDSIRYLDVTKLAPCLDIEIYVKSLVCPFLQKRPRIHLQQ